MTSKIEPGCFIKCRRMMVARDVPKHNVINSWDTWEGGNALVIAVGAEHDHDYPLVWLVSSSKIFVVWKSDLILSSGEL